MSLPLVCAYSPGFARTLHFTGRLLATVGRCLDHAGSHVARCGREMVSAGAQAQAIAWTARGRAR